MRMPQIQRVRFLMRKSALNGVHNPFRSAFGETPNEEKQDFLVFGKPDITSQEKEAVIGVLSSGWLSTGQIVKTFEKEFGEFIGTGYPVAVSSCTDGLILSLMVACVGDGAEVITSPLTFAATVNAILAVGAKPVFCDVDHHGQIDVENLEKHITDKTKAVIPVHYTGASCDMDQLRDIAFRHGIKVIEDAAHGFGGYYVRREGTIEAHGKQYLTNIPLGTMGDFGCFSFYATKNITCGEGGMVLCKSSDMAEKIRILSMQGLSANAYRRYGTGPIQSYEVTYAGRKSNLSDIHAAIGLTQLRRWKTELKEKRESIWRVYEQAFGKKEEGHSQHLFTVRHPKRDGLRQFLHSKGIGTGIHFRPLHLEPAYASLRYEKGSFPKSEKIGEITLSLPVSTTMSVTDAERVVNAVKEYGEGK